MVARSNQRCHNDREINLTAMFCASITSEYCLIFMAVFRIKRRATSSGTSKFISGKCVLAVRRRKVPCAKRMTERHKSGFMTARNISAHVCSQYTST
ncbi:hypothetical protein JOB18_026476 [Solea senegalensis]|uniref:Uncharacterized protein n=1 Tax=Solea senegalensis TaxID=28829 RepID=A0AAV6RB76_SOLSE|nr:hypothetical protein JOB18_026476 [Solea senegalensis]